MPAPRGYDMTSRQIDQTNVEQPIGQLDERTWDVLVIGGGIVGAGVARDAAQRGFRTLLVEQADFASGTSSRSSRLLHGGMRYLAQGRIALVHEASREKRVLGRIAPHLAQPLAFIFPGRKGTPWPRWKLAIGAKVYDLLCGMRNYGRSHALGRRKILALLPGLSEQNLTGGVRYFDALTNDARLVIDTIRSAARHGAAVFNYVRLLDASRNADAWSCELLDASTNRTQRVQARTVVNATGPWSDRLPHSKTSLRLTKGVHLVIDRDRLPVPDAVVMAEGHRILFAIPWGERVILGTTDTDYDGPLENPSCDAGDAQYVLDVVNDSFPQAGLTPADIVSTWAGLRPLVADPHGKPSDISRRHEVAMNGPGWWDITGGKLTTYRLMAEEAVSEIAKHLGRAAIKCRTAELPLLETSELKTGSGILPPPVSAELVKYYCQREWARHLDDVMIRRTSWHYYHRDRLEIAAQVADWMAGELNWEAPETHAELDRYREHVRFPMSVTGSAAPDDEKFRSSAPKQVIH
jgi:glycerol-3-phosphate dehydrogenase